MDILEGSVLGAVIQEGPKQVAGWVSRSLKFRESRRKLGSFVHHAIPVAQEMERLDQELGRPEEERAPLLEDLQEAEKVFKARSNVPCWHCCCLPFFQTQLEEALEALTRSNVNLMSLVVARDTKEILSIARNGVHGKQLMSWLKPPAKPDLIVGLGLDNPLSLFNKLKKQLLQPGTTVLVLSGLAGYGKTTLATLLCWDDQVRGKFGENILFLTVSKTSSLKTIVQSLFKHYGFVVPDLDLADDRRAISHLKNLEAIMKSPLMLVLDDVWPNTESLIEAFKVWGLSDYKILVTSRFNVQGFEPACRMEPLCFQDSVTLLRDLAVPNDGRSSSLSDGYEEKVDMIPQIARACYGSPLVLKLVGGSLKKERLNMWRQKKKKLSKGHPIIESHTEMFTIFKKYLDDGLDDKPIIKECFMDLGLFPEDQKIPVAALIDIWTERQHKLGDDLEQRQKLKKADAVNIVYDLTDRHLASLVVRRDVGIDLGDYCNHHFLMQHDLIREMVEASQEPYKQRKRLMFDMNENNWSKQRQQNTVAHTLSISTSEMSTPEYLDDIIKAEVVEVLVLNLRTKKYTLPEFIRKINELKVLIITNYDHLYCSMINNFELLGSLSSLKRIRLERVLVTTFGKWHNLRRLSLYDCNTREAFESDSIPISEALPNLVELCIDYCKDLVTLPSGLCDITSIKKLSITRCMRFIALPHDIGNLENLKTLRLSSCAVFDEIPASIGKLFQLRLLDISGCVSLHNLPEEIGNLRNLERLHMVGCASCKMPYSVTALENLKNVRCDEETAILWKEDFKPRLPNLKVEEANDHSLFIFYDI